ncbi:MAG: signal peptidase I [Magnetococcales bacterium]|nr:signal peptidase I [Magnetococcales bacterium]
MPRAWKKKHFWHGALFLAAGLFMLGSYVVIGEPIPREASEEIGPIIALVLIGVGIFLFVWGEDILKRESLAVEYYDAIVMAVGFALLIRTFILEPFKIPSGSMIPTLLVGDYLFVDKSAYGMRVPYSRTRIFMGEGPERGDIAVFEYPRDPSKDYIKRIVGLPGDKVVYRNKRLYLNDIPVEYQPGGPFIYRDERGNEVEAANFQEMLPGAPHPILVRPFVFAEDNTEEVIPPGHYFVLGDNRDNSNDSRFWGFVPGYRLVGKAVFLFWSWDRQEGSLRWERVGQAVE